jgi:glycosyltransferase involved in cell wall biosynthesis
MYSILIPTWNNLECLKLCVVSLQKYSSQAHEIIIHINDGSDGTLDWVKSQGLRYSHTEKNVGICLSLNNLVAKASHEWVLYMNDDMVACPDWDSAFDRAIKSTNTDLALYFGTLIEPRKSQSPLIINQDYGTSPETFDETALLSNYMNDARGDVEGAALQPTLVHRKWWTVVGGYSLEFSPGMSTDDDLLMKFWVAGCRNFRVVGNSRFYHFGFKSTGRVKHNLGGRIFATKWGITQKEFFNNYLGKLRSKPSSEVGPVLPGIASDFPRATRLGKLRRVGYGLSKDYPLEDIAAWDPFSAVGKWEESEK